MMKSIAESCPGYLIKPQQRDEPDLTQEEKEIRLTGIFQSDPASFLRRFRAHLKPEHLDEVRQRRKNTFRCSEDAHRNRNLDYEVEYLLYEIAEDLDEKKKKTKIKNRRYAAMNSLGEEDFFR